MKKVNGILATKWKLIALLMLSMMHAGCKQRNAGSSMAATSAPMILDYEGAYAAYKSLREESFERLRKSLLIGKIVDVYDGTYDDGSTAPVFSGVLLKDAQLSGDLSHSLELTLAHVSGPSAGKIEQFKEKEHNRGFRVVQVGNKGVSFDNSDLSQVEWVMMRWAKERLEKYLNNFQKFSSAPGTYKKSSDDQREGIISRLYYNEDNFRDAEALLNKDILHDPSGRPSHWFDCPSTWNLTVAAKSTFLIEMNVTAGKEKPTKFSLQKILSGKQFSFISSFSESKDGNYIVQPKLYLLDFLEDFNWDTLTGWLSFSDDFNSVVLRASAYDPTNAKFSSSSYVDRSESIRSVRCEWKRVATGT